MGFTAKLPSITVISKSTMLDNYSLLRVSILAGEMEITHINPHETIGSKTGSRLEGMYSSVSSKSIIISVHNKLQK